MSRRRRAAVADPEVGSDAARDDICAFYERPIPVGARASRHHLTPKLKGGAKLRTVRLHQICHTTIHARFSEAVLARRLNRVEALRTEPAFADFLAWIRTKPGDFYAPTAAPRKKISAL